MRKLKVGRTLLFFALVPGALNGPFFELDAAPGVQRIPNLTELHSLDSRKGKHTWWARSGKIDPAAYSRRFLAEFRAGPDKPGDAWKPVKVPDNIRAVAGFQNLDPRVVWYRKVFVLPEKVDEHLAVRLAEINDRDRAYFNGELIGATGDWNAKRAQAYDLRRIYNIPDRLIRKGGVNILLVQVKGFNFNDWGIYRNETLIGSSKKVWADYFITNFLKIVLLAIYFTAGLYFLFLFARRRMSTRSGRLRYENLTFGIFVMGLVTYQFLRTQMKYYLGIDFLTLKRIEYLVLFSMVPLLYLFVRAYFTIPRNKLVKIWDYASLGLIAFVLGLEAIVLFTDDAALWDHVNNAYNLPVWFVFLGAIFTILFYKLFKKDKDAGLILLGVFVLTIASFTDVLSNNGVIPLPRMTGYAFIVFILSLALILANRLVRLNEEVEDLNQNLELKVEKRTEELRETLEEVRTLKVQQDGDYFLTSLLIRPLGGIHVDSPAVGVEMLIRQKKKFQFRKWDAEIGGDLCAGDTIELKGRRYTVVMNGDGMGKSIQGAGGALVLGVMLKSVISRTQASREYRDKYPEKWLKDTFLELQSVFEAFDGSMLMSIVLGLVDDRTGYFYFLNAEHPGVVLYRGGEARFLGEEPLMKLGVTGIESGLQIRGFRMEAGDVVLAGSDGRDDLLLGMEEGVRIINEDENLFLKVVEESDGVLERMEEKLLARGELTDDLSLLRIAYLEDAPAREKILPEGVSDLLERSRKAQGANDPDAAISLLEEARGIAGDEPQVLRNLAELYLNRKEYAKAAPLCELYTEVMPEDSEFLFLTSYALKHGPNLTRKELEKAADFGERLRMRDKDHLKNLLNLSDIHRLLKNTARAEKLLTRALEIDPEDARALKLRDYLKGAAVHS